MAEPCQARLEKDSQYTREYRTARCPGEASGCLPGRFETLEFDLLSDCVWNRTSSEVLRASICIEMYLGLESCKRVEPMQVSDWAAPIVPVLKSDK